MTTRHGPDDHGNPASGGGDRDWGDPAGASGPGLGDRAGTGGGDPIGDDLAGAGGDPGWGDPAGGGWGYPADEDDVVGSLTAAEVTALAAADADQDELDPAEAQSGMPAELAALSGQQLADAYSAVWSVPATVAAAAAGGPGPQWPLSYQAAGYPGGEPPIEAVMPRDGSGGGPGFTDGGFLDTAPASLLLAGCADEAYQQAGGLDDDSLVGVLRAYRRLASQAAGRELALVAELARRRPAPGTPPGPPGGLPARLSEFLADELAPSLTLTSRAAHLEVDMALAVAGLPVTARLLEASRIDLPKTRVITEMLAPLSEFHARVVDMAIVPEAPELTTSELRDLLSRTILGIDPDAARRRRQRAEKQARVEYWTDPEGTASLAGRSLPPAQVLAADQRLTALADKWKKQGARGGMDRLRAHAYLALLLGHDTTTPPRALLPTRTPAPAPRPGTSGHQPGGRPPSQPAAGPSSSPTDGRSSPPAAPGQPGAGDPGADDADTGRGPQTSGVGMQETGPNPNPDCTAGGPATNGTGMPASASGASREGDSGACGGLPLTGEINLTMPLHTLLGLADAPGNAAGYGPQHADTCRQLIQAMSSHPATRWGLIITNPQGHAMAYGGPTRAKPTPTSKPAKAKPSRTGPGRTGSGNTGSGNTGSGNTGSGNTGSGNTGPSNTGPSNTGSGRADTARGSPSAQPAPARGSPGQPPGTPRGSPPATATRGSPPATAQPFGAGGWTITVTTEPIAPYH